MMTLSGPCTWQPHVPDNRMFRIESEWQSSWPGPLRWGTGTQIEMHLKMTLVWSRTGKVCCFISHLKNTDVVHSNRSERIQRKVVLPLKEKKCGFGEATRAPYLSRMSEVYRFMLELINYVSLPSLLPFVRCLNLSGRPDSRDLLREPSGRGSLCPHDSHDWSS